MGAALKIKVHRLRTVVWFIYVVLPLHALADGLIVDPLWEWDVTSDFGPRNDADNRWHEGIDFSAAGGDADLGTPLPSVEVGTVIAIQIPQDHFYNIQIEGDSTNKVWLYGHIFRNDVFSITDLTNSNLRWELKNATLIHPQNPNDTRNGPVIILWNGSRAEKILSRRNLAGLWVRLNDNAYIRAVDGSTATTRFRINRGEMIAPMGDAGTGDVHLHLGLDYPNNNPFFELRHPPDQRPKAFVEEPRNGQILGPGDLQRNVRFKALLDSRNGLDLDKVSLWILRNNNPVDQIHLGTRGLPTFGYGGKPGEQKTATMAHSPGGLITGYEPIGNIPGQDRFFFFENINSLPDGEHTFVVRCKDVNNNDGCENPEARVRFRMDRLALRPTRPYPTGSEADVETDVVVTLNERPHLQTIAGSMVVFRSGSPVLGDVQFHSETEENKDWDQDGDANDLVVVFQPTEDLRPAQNYTVTVRDTLTDEAGNRLDGDNDGRPGGNYTWTFRTRIPPPKLGHALLSQAYASEDIVIRSSITTYESSLLEAHLYYRAFRTPNERYTRVVFQNTGGSAYQAVIPASQVRVQDGLEYFLYAKDTAERITTLPPINGDPFLYTSTANPVTVFHATNNGNTIIGDADPGNDTLNVSFHLTRAVPVGRPVDIDLYETDHAFASQSFYQTLQAFPGSGLSPGVHSFSSIDGRFLLSGNYVFVLKERTEGAAAIISQGRFRVIRPFAQVDVAVTPGFPNDRVVTTVSRTSQRPAANTVFEARSLYRPSSERGEGPVYTVFVPHSDSGHGSGVYRRIGQKDVLIGLSGVPRINPNNAPEIFVNPLPTQTNGHIISVTANINDINRDGTPGRVGEARLYFKDSLAPVYQSAPMRLVNGDTYTAEISSQPGNNTVFYYVEALDNENFTGSDPVINPATEPYRFHVTVDNTPPAVVRTSLNPSHESTDVSINPTISAGFSERLRPLQSDTEYVRLQTIEGTSVDIDSASVVYAAGRLRFQPRQSLTPQTTYVAILMDVLEDLSGNRLDGDEDGRPGGHFRWRFETEAILPVSIRAVSHAPINFASTTPHMDFTAEISTPVSSVAVVLTDVLNPAQVIRVVDSTGTPVEASYPYAYRLRWDGRVNEQLIPDGVYKIHMEGVDREHGVMGNSNIQPVRWRVEGQGVTAYHKKATNLSFRTVNDQHVKLEYDYHRFSRNAMVLRIQSPAGSRESRIGSSSDRFWGRAGTQFEFVPANSQCTLVNNAAGTLEAHYVRRYIDVSSSPFLIQPSIKQRVELLPFHSPFSTIFEIPFVPAAADPFEPDDPPFIQTEAVNLDAMRIRFPGPDLDFDDNPDVRTWVDAVRFGTATLRVALHGRHIGSLPLPIIYDRTPPVFQVAVDRPIFSSVLGQEVRAGFTLADNMPFGLKETYLNITDTQDRLIKSLYQEPYDVPGDRSLRWDGTNTQGRRVSDGVYIFKGGGKDNVDNVAQATSTVIVDSTPPLIQNPTVRVVPGARAMVFTSADSRIEAGFLLSDNLSSSVSLELRARKQEGDPVDVVIRSTTGVNATPRALTLLWDGKDSLGNNVPDGLYTLALAAWDTPGNAVTINLPPVRVDRVPSLIQYLFADNILFTPDDGPLGQGDGQQDIVTLIYRIGDNSATTITIENQLGQVLQSVQRNDPGNVEQRFQWDGRVGPNFVADGAYILRIQTVDESGNQDTKAVAVVKNQIPAQFVFPDRNQQPFIQLGGNVSLQGIAVDPFINDTVSFGDYRLWVRSGGNIDFSRPENNPATMGPPLWQPIVVPGSYQSPNFALNPLYPSSNISKRSISNSTLGTWIASPLQNGTTHTLLLVVKDGSNRISFDAVSVRINHTIDNTFPIVAILAPPHQSPPVNIVLRSMDERIALTYTIAQQNGKRANVSIEIYQMRTSTSFGPVVFQRDYLDQAAGQTVYWDGRDAREQLVPDGLYRIRIVARDTDNIELDTKEVDIELGVQFTLPVKVLSFQAAPSLARPSENVQLSYTLSKEADVTARGFNISNQQVGIYRGRNSSATFNFSTNTPGIYRWELDAISVGTPRTRDNASLSIVVGGPGGGGDAGITATNPEPVGGAVRGLPNFSWTGAASGWHYPPQSFAPVLRASGQEQTVNRTVTETDFLVGTRTNTMASGGNLSLTPIDQSQFQHSTSNWTQVEFVGVGGNPVYCANRFRIGCNRALTRVEFYVSPGWRAWYTPPPNQRTVYSGCFFWIQIRDDNQGRPGNILSEAALGENASLTPLWIGANLNTPIQGNRDYWIVLKAAFNLNPPVPGAGYSGVNSSLKVYGFPYPFCGPPPCPDPPARFKFEVGDWVQGNTNGHYWGNIYRLSHRINFSGACYPPSGRYLSPAIDTQRSPSGTIFFQPFEANHALNGQQVQYKMQMSDDGTNWTPESPVTPGQPITIPGRRYFRNIVDLTALDQTQTPVVHDYTVRFRVIEPFSFQRTLQDPSYTTYFNKPKFIPDPPRDLSMFFPELQGRVITQGPAYSLHGSGNPQVNTILTTEGGPLRIKGTTAYREPWNSGMDQGIQAGRFGHPFTEYNNSPNAVDFTTEAPFNFSQQNRGVRPIPISSRYPQVNMAADPSVRNKYTFWKDGQGNTIDNPYVGIDAQARNWNIQLAYPDGSANNTITLNHDPSRPANRNTDPSTLGNPLDLDDDFTVRLATGAIPKVFIELKGHTPSPAQGFNSYAMFYRKASESIFRSIPVVNPMRPVPPGGTLAFWNVTGLQGDYVVKLIAFSNGGQVEATRNVTVGTLVRGVGPLSTPTVVNGPYNKSFLQFSSNSIVNDTVVTITPRRLSDTGLIFSTSMPQPVGVVYDLQPKTIEFVRTGTGTVVLPAALTVRFLPQELEGIDPGQLVIYRITDSGVLQALDARVQVVNGITEITSPVTGFSYFFAFPDVLPPVLEPVTFQPGLALVRGRVSPDAMVDVFLNNSSACHTRADAGGQFNCNVRPVHGRNILTARARMYIGVGTQRVERASQMSAPQTFQYDAIPPRIESISVSSRTFCNFELQATTLTFVLSELSSVTVAIQSLDCQSNCVRYFLINEPRPQGLVTVVWDGRNSQGQLVPPGAHRFGIGATDVSGNRSPGYGATVMTVNYEPPRNTIRNPLAGQIYGDAASPLTVDFTVTDNVDPSPQFEAALRHQTLQTRIPVTPGQQVNPFLLDQGPWELVVDSRDRSGYARHSVSGPFTVAYDRVPPAPVTTLAATPVSSDTLRLAWTSTGDDGSIGQTTGTYRIALSTDSNAVFTPDEYRTQGHAVILPGYAAEALVSGLQPLTTYYAALFLADDQNNWSAASNIASASTLSLHARDNTPPRGPVGFVRELDSFSEVVISFEDEFDGVHPHGAVIATRNSEPFTEFTVSTISFNQMVITNHVPQNGVYIFVITPRDLAGNIGNPTPIRVLDMLPPIENASAESGAQIRLSWTAPSVDGGTIPASSYLIKHSSQPIRNQADFEAAETYNPERTVLPGLPGTEESIQVIGLPPLENRYFALTYADSYSNRGALSFGNELAAPASPFGDAQADLLDLEQGQLVKAGDYDNDGDVDLVVSGFFEGEPITLLYDNRAGRFFLNTHHDLGEEPLGDAAWVDYDEDGDLDLIALPLEGYGPTTPELKFFKNQNGTLGPDVSQALAGVFGRMAVGDIEGDGDVDLVLSGTGCEPSCPAVLVYRNRLGRFELDENHIFFGFSHKLALGDTDSDGDLDLFLSHRDAELEPYLDFYRYENGLFQHAQRIGPYFFDMVLDDVDQDGGLELMGTGTDDQIVHNPTEVTGRVFRCEEGQWVELSTFTGVTGAGLALADVNNDGVKDAVLSGNELNGGERFTTKALLNLSGGFSWAHPVSGAASPVALADFDNDGDVDIAQPGRIYLNFWTPFRAPNQRPLAPSRVQAQYFLSALQVSWDAAHDEESGPFQLQYNIRIGTASGCGNVISGVYGTPLLGNYRSTRISPSQLGIRIHHPVKHLYYHCSVQTIDAGLKTSDWSDEIVVPLLSREVSPVEPGQLSVPPPSRIYEIDNFYVFPNPVSRGQKPVLRMELDWADSATIEIFDVSGRKVHEAAFPHPPQPLRPYGGFSARPGYEYRWEGNISSGLYLYVVQATKGNARVIKTGQFAVTR